MESKDIMAVSPFQGFYNQPTIINSIYKSRKNNEPGVRIRSCQAPVVMHPISDGQTVSYIPASQRVFKNNLIVLKSGNR